MKKPRRAFVEACAESLQKRTTEWYQMNRTERRVVLYHIVRRLQPEASARAVEAELARQYDIQPRLGWVIGVLDRMEDAGYLNSTTRPVSDPLSSPPIRRYFTSPGSSLG